MMDGSSHRVADELLVGAEQQLQQHHLKMEQQHPYTQDSVMTNQVAHYPYILLPVACATYWSDPHRVK